MKRSKLASVVKNLSPKASQRAIAELALPSSTKTLTFTPNDSTRSRLNSKDGSEGSNCKLCMRLSMNVCRFWQNILISSFGFRQNKYPSSFAPPYLRDIGPLQISRAYPCHNCSFSIWLPVEFKAKNEMNSSSSLSNFAIGHNHTLLPLEFGKNVFLSHYPGQFLPCEIFHLIDFIQTKIFDIAYRCATILKDSQSHRRLLVKR